MGSTSTVSEIIHILTHACGSHTKHNNKTQYLGLVRGPLPTPRTTTTMNSNVPPRAVVPTRPYDVLSAHTSSGHYNEKDAPWHPARPRMPQCAVIQVHVVTTIDMGYIQQGSDAHRRHGVNKYRQRSSHILTHAYGSHTEKNNKKQYLGFSCRDPC